jgi:hypothetical protein
MPIETVMMPFDCKVGEEVVLMVGGQLAVRGLVIEVITPGSNYKMDVEDSVLQAALRRRRGEQ